MKQYILALNSYAFLLVISLLSLAACGSADEVILMSNNEVNTTATSEDCENQVSTFTINLNPNDCNVALSNALGSASQYAEVLSGTTRSISINSIASHMVGEFPNSGNPHSINAITQTFSLPTNPSLADQITNAQGYDTGVLFSGVTVDPYTAEFFQTSTGGFNREWNRTTLSTSRDLGLDCNNAHVQPSGKYHYHGTPSAYVAQLGINGTEMVKVGYAADGFPIYYKYAYAEDGNSIIALESGYQIIDGARPGNGSTAPGGCYDGTYFQDYEYVEGISLLDECNGRFGRTPEAPNGAYYYVITDNFPSVPICFAGTPDDSFSKR
ncbi:MAG: YHYH protein [Bacteroidota bacterium]